MTLARRIAVAFFWLAIAGWAQPTLTYSIRNFAGVPRFLGDGGPATAALLWSPRGVSADSAGNIYIADSVDARIRKVTPDGIITTIAGSTAGFAGDSGPALSAQLAFPSKAVATPNGDLYIADSSNNRIRRVSANGIITTIAGTGQAGFTGDSDSATSIQLSFPRDLIVDPLGNVYIADTNNTRVRRLTPQGKIVTVAGSGYFGFSGDDAPANRSALAVPRGVAVDIVGNLYIADTLNNRIRKVAPDGTISTIAGTNNAGFSGDSGQAVVAQLNGPTSIAVDLRGNVYFTDTGNNRVRRVTPQGVITTVAGTGANGFRGDNGPATAAQLNAPQSVAFDAVGNIYIADTENHRIRKVDSQGVITTVAGSDPGAGDGGTALSARLFQPSGIAIDATGNVYVADTSNHRIRVITPQGAINNVAGNGSAGYGGDGKQATLSQLNGPNGIALDRAGNLYIADTGNHVIRRVSNGVIATVAGNGEAGNAGDGGPPINASFFNPSAVAFDKQGNLYIADSANNRVREVVNGNLRNFAGDASGLPGFSGDGGPAGAASLNYPLALAVDDAGNVYISDYFNNRVRRVLANGTSIGTFAGGGTQSGPGDGIAATQSQLFLPAGIAVDSNRNVYIADLLGSRIRAVGANGLIRTIAGDGNRGNSGDGGLGTAAMLASPRDIVVDAQGKIYFTDQDNNRVRVLTAASISIQIIVNAASLISGPIAAGEAISIYGPQLAPNISFDGVPATVLYASSNQVNAIVPASVAGKTLTQLQVQSAELGSGTFVLAVRDASPGIFTIDGSGSGQGAIVNQEGTINSATNPAAPGSIVSIYATGQGVLDGAQVRIQGLTADVQFAGSVAPGLYQINVRVPANVFTSMRSPVELSIGTFAAQPSVTIAVQ